MELEYTAVGQLKITMLDYIDEILNTFDKANQTGGGINSSSAPYIILKVDKDYKKINAKQAV